MIMATREIEILLVEDDKSDAEMTIRALHKNKLANNITHVANGALALDFLFARGNYAGRDIDDQPKLILLDIKMPKVSGIEVLKILKDDEATKKIPVVMLTSSKEDPDIEACYRLGVNGYIVKPVEFEDFMKTVTELGVYWMIYNEPPK